MIVEKKKILYLSPLPPPFYGSALSSQTCLNILNENDNIEVFNIKLNYSKTFQDVGSFSFYKIWGYINAICNSIYYFYKFKPDLIYIMPATSGWAFLRDFSLSLLFKILNSNIIFHLRTRLNEPNKLKHLIFKKTFNNNFAIILGEELKSEISKYFKEENIMILPNAIEGTLVEEEYKRIEDKRNVEKHFRLLFLSNMMMSKGWPKVLEAANYLNKKGVDFTLKFAGNWPSPTEERFFHKYVTDNNLYEKIIYVGSINDESKSEIFGNSDVLLFPTEYKQETFGRVIIEAMEYGIPVIANCIGSIPSIISHGKTGFVLKVNSVEEISNYVLELKNQDVLIQMGRDSRLRFQEYFEIENYTKKFISDIEFVLMKIEIK